MKNALMLLAVIALLAVHAQAQTYSPSVSVVLTSQQPFPAEPGRNVEIEVEIKNKGLVETNDISMKIAPRSPFSLLPGEEETKKFSQVKALSSVKTTYKLHIDSDAVTNDYEVEFQMTTGKVEYQKEKVKVSVQGRPKIVLKKILLEPENVDAGGTTGMSVHITNEGTGTARHLTLYLNSTPEIIPLLSDAAYYIGDLAPKQDAMARMRLSIDESATQKTYVARLSAAYQDEANSRNTEVFDIGIPVMGTIKLDIIKTEANYERGNIEIEVANKGTAEAKSVEARLFVDDRLVDIDYTSQIKPTKKVTFSFPLQAAGRGTLEIKYTGPALQETSIRKDIVFDFKTPNGQQDSSWMVLLVVVIAVAAVFWWKRRKKK